MQPRRGVRVWRTGLRAGAHSQDQHGGCTSLTPDKFFEVACPEPVWSREENYRAKCGMYLYFKARQPPPPPPSRRSMLDPPLKTFNSNCHPERRGAIWWWISGEARFRMHSPGVVGYFTQSGHQVMLGFDRMVGISANTRRWINAAGLMLAHDLRCWTIVSPAYNAILCDMLLLEDTLWHNSIRCDTIWFDKIK